MMKEKFISRRENVIWRLGLTWQGKEVSGQIRISEDV